MRRITPSSSIVARRLLAGVLAGLAIALAACGPKRGESLAQSDRDYRAGRYEAALRSARAAAVGANGIELDRARYLEGIALLQLDRPMDAIAPLRDACDAADQALAGDALVSLGTALVRTRDFDAAGQAYRRAAMNLDGDDARRAHEVAARCFDRAGLTVAAEDERALAGLPRTAPTPPSRVVERPSPPTRDTTPPAPATANSRPATPSTFSVQAGAFSDRARAEQVAASLAGPARRAGLPSPRIAVKTKNGVTLFTVQVGAFASRPAAGKALRALGQSGCTIERTVPGS